MVAELASHSWRVLWKAGLCATNAMAKQSMRRSLGRASQSVEPACSLCQWSDLDVIRCPESDGVADGFLCSWCLRMGYTIEDVQGMLLRPLTKHWPGGPGVWPAQILDWLFLGDLDNALNLYQLQQLGITLVISLCPEHVDTKAAAKFRTIEAAGIQIASLAAIDDEKFNIYEITWPAVRAILSVTPQPRTLINCWGGVNRSAAIVGMVLVDLQGFTFLDTMRRMMGIRRNVLTNMAFRRALLDHHLRSRWK